MTAGMKIPTGVQNLTVEELAELLKGARKPFVLDVRSPEEFATDHIEGAVNVPIQEIQLRAKKALPKEAAGTRQIACVCEHGQRSSMAAAILSWMGFKDVRSLLGGLDEWRQAGHKTVQGKTVRRP